MGRAIDQDGVIALIDLKVAALQEKLNESFTPDSTDEKMWRAKISAMNAVKGHLKYIEDYKFPMNATENRQTMDEMMPDLVLRDKVTGRYYQAANLWGENPRDAWIFPYINDHHVGNSQEMVPYKDAIKETANPRPLPPEVAMIEEIEQAEQRSK